MTACFFNPMHSAVQDVLWAPPPDGSPRQVPACAQCVATQQQFTQRLQAAMAPAPPAAAGQPASWTKEEASAGKGQSNPHTGLKIAGEAVAGLAGGALLGSALSSGNESEHSSPYMPAASYEADDDDDW